MEAVHRYFEGFDGEAREHLRDVDRRLERVNQVHFNLTAERGVAVKRIEATSSILEALRDLAGALREVLDRFGRATSDFFEYAGGLTLLSAESLGFMARFRIRVGETISQCALLGVQSAAIVMLTTLFTGMVISLESAQQAVAYGFATSSAVRSRMLPSASSARC